MKTEPLVDPKVGDMIFSDTNLVAKITRLSASGFYFAVQNGVWDGVYNAMTKVMKVIETDTDIPDITFVRILSMTGKERVDYYVR